VQIKGLTPFGAQTEAKIGKILGLCKNILLTHQSGLKPWDKEIKICANEVPGVINGHVLRGHTVVIYTG